MASRRDLSEGTLGQLIGELAADETTGPAYIKKAWVMSAISSLREARIHAGKTQADIAAELGTTQSAIARLEKDRNGRLNLRRFAEYAIACQVAPLDIALEPLEDVQAFTAANPGRDRSPWKYYGWTHRNQLSPAATSNLSIAAGQELSAVNAVAYGEAGGPRLTYGAGRGPVVVLPTTTLTTSLTPTERPRSVPLNSQQAG